MGEEFFELGFMDCVVVGETCSCCCAAGFYDCFVEEGAIFGVVEDVVTYLYGV